MNEFVRNLIGKIDLKEGWFGNERDLAKLDAESLELELEAYEERVEELEYDSEDYYTIDKTTFEVKLNKLLVGHFLDINGEQQVPYEHIEYAVLSDMIEEIVNDSLDMMEKESET